MKECQFTKTQQRYKGASRNLTLQHLADGLNDTNKKGVAFLKMHDSGHQTRHFIFQNGYLLHQAIRFADLVHSSFCLMLHQRQMAFEVRNPRQVFGAMARRTGGEGIAERNTSAGGVSQPRSIGPPVHSRWKARRQEENNSEKQTSLTFHKGKVFTKSIEFPD
jgi:hypothetical protein